MSEQREILRRIAERGLKLAQSGSVQGDADTANAHYRHLDLWQHMLDEIARLPASEGDSDR